jgi:hypothetical protein
MQACTCGFQYCDTERLRERCIQKDGALTKNLYTVELRKTTNDQSDKCVRRARPDAQLDQAE